MLPCTIHHLEALFAVSDTMALGVSVSVWTNHGAALQDMTVTLIDALMRIHHRDLVCTHHTQLAFWLRHCYDFFIKASQKSG